MIKKILVALDGSEHANHALDYALDLAESCSANIELLTVFQPVYSLISDELDYIAPSVTERYLDALKDYHKKVLSEGLKRANELKPHLKISTKLAEGRPADEIVEKAKEGNFDLIVIGSRGLGGVTQLLLGSVSGKVASHASCPVLIIR